MAQQTFNNGEVQSSVRAKINSNATDAESRLTSLEGFAVAIIEDHKPNATYGGASVAGWQTRDLNTIVSDSESIITSLTSNQFILTSGTYLIEVVCPNYLTQAIKSAISIDGTRTLISSSAQSSNSGGSSYTHISGIFTSTGAESLRVDNFCGVATVTSGLGVRSNSGEVEVYTQVKITKKG